MALRFLGDFFLSALHQICYNGRQKTPLLFKIFFMEESLLCFAPIAAAMSPTARSFAPIAVQ